MEITRCSIQGANPNSLIHALKEEITDSYTYTSNQVSIITTEKYFLRTNSNLLTTIIVDSSNPSNIFIEIISGGGGTGILQMGWGSEGSANKKIMKTLQNICDTHSWKLNETRSASQPTESNYDL